MSEPGEQPMIRLVGVSKTYRMGVVDVPVLHEIDLEVAPAEMVVIVGPSGSGKSTLLNIVGGVDRPSSGQAWFRDRNLTIMTDAQLTRYRRDHVGYIFQFYNLVPTLTAAENVQVAAEISSDPMDPREALEMVGMGHRVDYFPAQMSGGEQQRVAVARALAKNPELLLCDEPTGALDLETGRPVLDALVKLNRQMHKTMIVITHNAPIAKLGHRMLRLGSGRIVEEQVHRELAGVREIAW
jgi:putative ABC transport system ATP-binding protein